MVAFHKRGFQCSFSLSFGISVVLDFYIFIVYFVYTVAPSFPLFYFTSSLKLGVQEFSVVPLFSTLVLFWGVLGSVYTGLISFGISVTFVLNVLLDSSGQNIVGIGGSPVYNFI